MCWFSVLILCTMYAILCGCTASQYQHLFAYSMYDPLEDNSEIAKDEAEGQNSTIVDHVLLDTQKDCAASQKVCI